MSKINPNPIYFVCGGTGGHCFPAKALRHYFADQGHATRICVDQRGHHFFKEEDISRLPIQVFHISPPSANRLWYLFSLKRTFFQALYLMLKQRPKYLISFGGYTAFPFLLAALLLGIPFYLQEQNVRIGRVHRLFYPFARHVFFGLKEDHNLAGRKKTSYSVTGNPLRLELVNYLNTPLSEPYTILIMGGSQGARFFQKIAESICMLPLELQKKLSVYHHARAEDIPALNTLYQKHNITHEVRDFFDPIFPIIAKAHLVICRAGAMSISELLALGKPGLYIPLPSAQDDHQTENARHVVAHGAGWLVPQLQVSVESLTHFIHNIFTTPNLLEQTAENARNLAQLEACQNIYHYFVSKDSVK